MKLEKGDSLASYEGQGLAVTGALRRAWASTAVQAIVDTLFPFPCLACESAPSTPPLGLCRRCRSAVRGISGPRCRRCGASLSQVAGLRPRECGECLARPGPIDRLWSLYEYRPPLDRVIHAYKFGRLERLGSTFARLAHDRFAEDFYGFDAVVPVPLHWARRLSRGFNQSTAIARPLSRSLGVALVEPLSHRAGTPQSQLDLRERAHQAARLLRLRGGRRLCGQRVLIVDDVTTTGATLGAAARLLRRAGAVSVGALVVARTPRR